MTEIRLAVAVIHAAHIEARRPLMQRLRAQLGALPAWVTTYKEITIKGPWWVWEPYKLDWFAEQDVTHCLTLQDDVILPPDFWAWLRALLEARPDDVICLDCAHPGARVVATTGAPGYTSFDNMIGIGHVEPISVVKDFIRWRLEDVRPQALKQITEDTLFALYCMSVHRPFFAPVPCIIDHDLGITSTNQGFDDHWYRKPQVTWRDLDRFGVVNVEQLSEPSYWAKDAPNIGRFYDDAYRYLPMVLLDTERGEMLAGEYHAVETPKEYRRFFLRTTGHGRAQ